MYTITCNFTLLAGIAQSVEQLIRNQQVACSSHVSSSKTPTRVVGVFPLLQRMGKAAVCARRENRSSKAERRLAAPIPHHDYPRPKRRRRMDKRQNIRQNGRDSRSAGCSCFKMEAVLPYAGGCRKMQTVSGCRQSAYAPGRAAYSDSPAKGAIAAAGPHPLAAVSACGSNGELSPPLDGEMGNPPSRPISTEGTYAKNGRPANARHPSSHRPCADSGATKTKLARRNPSPGQF